MMPADYLHGVETITIQSGARAVKLVKAAVTGLIGTSPIGPVNTPTLILSDKDAAQFGIDLPGFTIASALDANFDQGRPTAGVVIVVNVLNPAIHKTNVANESVTFDAAGAAKLTKPGVYNLALKSSDGATTYTPGVDYSLNVTTGALSLASGGRLVVGTAYKASFDYADPTKVTAADVIGAIDAAGKRTGMKSLLDSYTLFGFFPKRLISPVYCTTNGVAAEMISMANRLRARAYIDAPIGITPTQAITGRGASGVINFNTSNPRAKLCYPCAKVYDAAINGDRLEPLSQRLAGLGNAIDIERGYWWSSSNQELLGITGMERTISAMVNDPNCEANQLNAVGITTMFNSFGTGIRAWGNRMANFPAETGPQTFESVLAVCDVVDESIEYFSMQFLDQPGSKAWIDSVVESINGFIRKLIGDGALIDGKCWFDPADNEVAEMADGHYVFSRDLMPPTPGERITHKTQININYLKNLFK